MSNTFETDVLIVGGGPAGSSTALSLLKYSKLKVMIVEQGDLSTLRVGEQVSASIFDLLTYLGISKNEFKEDCFLPAYDNLSAWGSLNISSRHSVLSAQIEGFQLDRENFDLLLLEKSAERGAIIFPRTKTMALQQKENFWLAELKHETKGDFNIKTKYLVDASGRQSHVSRKVGASFLKFDDLVSVGSYLQHSQNHLPKQEILLETAEEGWWYYAVLPNKKIVVSLFTDATIVKEKHLQKTEIWLETLQKTEHIKKKLANTVSNENLWVRNAFSHLTDTSSQLNFIAVGDAAASFDPISSMGIGFAISSACNGAKAIMDHDLNEHSLTKYQKNISHIFINYIKNKSTFYNKEQRWKDAPFWKSRISI